jgi:hypothetical protein
MPDNPNKAGWSSGGSCGPGPFGHPSPKPMEPRAWCPRCGAHRLRSGIPESASAITLRTLGQHLLRPEGDHQASSRSSPRRVLMSAVWWFQRKS